MSNNSEMTRRTSETSRLSNLRMPASSPAIGRNRDSGIHGRRLLCLCAPTIIIGGIIAFIVFLVHGRTTHPQFYLEDATFRQLDLANGSTAAGILSTVLQVTIAYRNPNGRVGIYYDHLDVYASYRHQQVTVAASLPPLYHGHHEQTILSPVVAGPNVPLEPYLVDALAEEVAAGYLIMQVKIDGHVRRKVGAWTSGQYHIFVTCPAFFISSGGNGVVGADGLKFQAAQYCRVQV